MGKPTADDDRTYRISDHDQQHLANRNEVIALHVETDQGLVARLPGRLAGDGLVAPSAIPALDGHPEGFRPR